MPYFAVYVKGTTSFRIEADTLEDAEATVDDWSHADLLDYCDNADNWHIYVTELEELT